MKPMRHFLEIDDLEVEELQLVLQLSVATKPPRVLDGQGVALIFEKPSGRTRNSMEMAVVQLGGHPIIDPAGATIVTETRTTTMPVMATGLCRVDIQSQTVEDLVAQALQELTAKN